MGATVGIESGAPVLTGVSDVGFKVEDAAVFASRHPSGLRIPLEAVDLAHYLDRDIGS